MKRAIGYVRVSTQGQRDDGVSLEAQRDRIAAWCAANGYELVEVCEDAGISGGTLTKRPGIQRALASIRKGDALVSYSMSRLARSTRDMLDIAERLRSKRADLVSLTEQIDTTTAAGRMQFQVLAVLAEFERELARERTRDALAHKRRKGEVYGPEPLGFSAVEGRLVEVREEARTVAEIMRLRDEGASYWTIADRLNAAGVATKRGGAKWYPATIRNVVQRQQAVAA